MPKLASPRRRPWGLLLSLALAVGAMGATESVAHAEGAKIAVVDVRRAVLETEEGLRVQATLKKLFDSRQVELDGRQRSLQNEGEELEKEKKSGKTPQDVLQKKYEALLKQQAELQSLMVDYQREMQRKEGELTTPILNKVLGIVRRIASQDGFEMILEKSAVPFYRSDLEITDKAIQMYNSGQAGDAAPGGKAPEAPKTDPKKPAPAPAPKPKK